MPAAGGAVQPPVRLETAQLMHPGYPTCTRAPVSVRRWRRRSGAHGWSTTTPSGHRRPPAARGRRSRRPETCPSSSSPRRRTPRNGPGSPRSRPSSSSSPFGTWTPRTGTSSTASKASPPPHQRAPVQVPQGQPTGRPLHRERPLVHHSQREAAPAEDRRSEGEVVAHAALHAVHGDRGEGRGRPVLRVLRCGDGRLGGAARGDPRDRH